MPIAWHHNKWWNFCMSEDEKKKQIQFLLKKCEVCVNVYTCKCLKQFTTYYNSNYLYL